MLPVPVLRTFKSALKGTTDLKFLRPGQQMEFKPHRDRSNLNISFKGKPLQIQRSRSWEMKLFHIKAQVFWSVTLCLTDISKVRNFFITV